MNKKEIQEALKIIREPIVVNCIEYKYFDQENYDKLVRSYENCRWFVDNWEQFEQNVEYQKKEIDRLNNIINKAKIKIESMFNVGDETKIIDDLLELNKILSGSDEE